MNKLSIITLLLFAQTIILAQDDILFESTLYFEDAIGNKDSIVYGYAENEEIDIFNPFYGEEEINSPFDSIFEVRATHEHHGRKPYTKKIITHVFDQNYDIDNKCFRRAAPPFFVIHAKHFPVKMSWDRKNFRNMHCVEGSMLIGHNRPFFSDNWFENEDFLVEAACMAIDSFVYKLENGFEYEVFEIPVEVQGNQSALAKVAFILYREDFHFGGMCKAEETNSVYNYASLPSLSPFPNPVNEVFHFGIEQARDYEIIDLHGRIVLSGKHKEAEVQFLSSGVYYLKVEGYAPQRFIKM